MNKIYENIQNQNKISSNEINALKENSMLVKNPYLWVEWDFLKNKDLNIYSITKGSRKVAWWICSKCGSSYDMDIQNRTRRNCPYCAGKRVNETNSLYSKNKDLLNLWCFESNKEVSPTTVTSSSDKKVWWVCIDCEEKHLTRIKDKVKSKGCPYCSGHRTSISKSLYVNNPDLAKEWHPYKNKNKSPKEFTCGSSIKVWWLGKCGHEWESHIKSRNNGSGCPYCSKCNAKVLKNFNDIHTTNKKLAKILENKEDGYRYSEFSSKKINFKCPNCKMVIKEKAISDVNLYGLSCFNCSDSISYPEKMMRTILNSIGIEFIKEKCFEWSGNKRYDFYIPSINCIIEMHGRQHYDNGFESLGGRSLCQEIENDIYKKKIALENNIDRYVVINASRSNFNFIKNNILESILTDILFPENIDWENIKDIMMKLKK